VKGKRNPEADGVRLGKGFLFSKIRVKGILVISLKIGII